MNAYRVRIADYLRTQKVIAQNFLTAAAAAEQVCERATHSVITNFEQNAAQAAFKSQFHAAYRVRTAALKALGPRPVMPIGYESSEISHETHKIEPYGCNQQQSFAALGKYI